MPLLNANPLAIPERHDGCRSSPCLQCLADANLTYNDREVIDFHELVRDQVTDMTPFGVEGGGPHDLRPRLEGWVAVCEVYNVPRERRAELIDMARFLFTAVHGRIQVHGLFRMPLEAFREPTMTELLNG